MITKVSVKEGKSLQQLRTVKKVWFTPCFNSECPTTRGKRGKSLAGAKESDYFEKQPVQHPLLYACVYTHPENEVNRKAEKTFLHFFLLWLRETSQNLLS